jgi:hypothetical protein
MSGETQTSSIRESLNAAMEKVEKTNESVDRHDVAGSAGAGTADSAPSVDSSGDVSVASPGESSGDRRADGSDSGAGGKTGERVRGPDGKFAKAEAAATKSPPEVVKVATPAPVAAEPSATPAPVPAIQTAVKAPQSWRPEIREKFAALPPEVQAEVVRREAEVQQMAQTIAPAKRLHQAVAQFDHMFKAEGIAAEQAIPSILQTVQRLATGTPQERATIVAQMVRGYGVDIQALAQAIDAPAPQAQPQQVSPQAMAEQAWQHLQQRAEQEQIQAALQEFGATPREFLSNAEVEQTMTAIIVSARARGEPASVKLLADAYDRACMATPDVRATIQQREAAKAAQAAQAEAQRARNASASVKTTSTAVSPAVPKSRREALEEAAAKVGR